MIPATDGQLRLSSPGGGLVAAGRELTEARLGSVERLLGIVEPPLLEECAAEHELGVPDLVEEIHPAVEEGQRMPRLLLGLLDVPAAEMNLCQRGDRLRGVDFAVDLDRRR